MAKIFDKWEFIAEWLPDYYQNDDVAYSNDLDCYIHGESENSQFERLQKEFPEVADAIEEQRKVDSRLFIEAYQNYVKSPKQEETTEYKIAVLQELWKIFASVPVTDDDLIACDFMGFDAGTSRLDVWMWFDERCPNGLILDLMSEIL